MKIDVTPGIVAQVRVDDHRTRNALGLDTVRELTQAVNAIGSAETTRVVVLSGANGTFSSGANLKEDVDARDVVREVGALYAAIRHCPTPVLARVEGACLGLAVGLIAACDLVIAARGTRFALPEPTKGQVATLAAVTLIPRLRVADTKRLLLTGTDFDADEAVDFGLVDRSVPRELLPGEEQRLVDRLLQGGPAALAATKRLIREISAVGFEQSMLLAGGMTVEIAASAEAEEGRRAVAERRTPQWAASDSKGNHG